MREKKIGIIDLGINNLHSIKEACNSLGYKTYLISLEKKDYNYDILILPGIGSFRKAMQIINENNIKEKILKHLRDKRKFLVGICLGMQIFFSQSEEFGSTKGLNLIEGSVKKFNKKLIVPHTGWNSINIIKNDNIIKKQLKKDMFYFTHSFYCKPKNKKFILGNTKYSNFKFCSIIKKDNIFGMQFHPEKSGLSGLEVLKSLHKMKI
jgi:glutamine amidotransferase|tara:strand:+ start:41 stop:664 length:624 start_codon:yes stop_codon:yes gene_type:complete